MGVNWGRDSWIVNCEEWTEAGNVAKELRSQAAKNVGWSVGHTCPTNYPKKVTKIRLAA